jgi:DNA (cytosine-5)-methyltransferase 1
VFVVGCLGDWKPAAEVLFESESLSRNIKQSKKEREKTAKCLTTRIRNDYETESFITIPIHAQATQYKGGGDNRNNDGKGNGLGIGKPGDPMNTLDTSSRHAVAVGFNSNARPDEMKFLEEQANTLTASQNSGVAQFVDVYNQTIDGQISATMTMACGGSNTSGPKIMQSMAVRRLTEVECERLQGFPDNYTNIRENCPSGARYKALGNSMAVPVMRWIGERINQYEQRI